MLLAIDGLHNLYRYTKNATDGSVYAIVLKWPADNILTLGSVKTTAFSIATLLGYGRVQFNTNFMGQMEITMPPLPLDSNLMWAWTFKLENIAPAMMLRNRNTVL